MPSNSAQFPKLRALAFAMAEIDGYSEGEVASFYFNEAEEIIKRLGAAGWTLIKGPPDDGKENL